MNWYEKYMSVPFVDKGREMDGADCWGLARLIYKDELGIELPDYLDAYEHTLERKAISLHISDVYEKNWVKVEEPKEFDLVIVDISGVPMHIGIVTKKDHMIHCSRDVNTAHESLKTSRWKHKIRGFARYER